MRDKARKCYSYASVVLMVAVVLFTLVRLCA